MISHEELEDLRTEARDALQQSYTLTSTVPTGEDGHGQKLRVGVGVPTSWSCYYAPAGEKVMTDLGPIIRSKPELYVLPVDPIAPGDVVTNIVDELGAIVALGPFVVDEVGPGGGLMNAYKKVAMSLATRGTN